MAIFMDRHDLPGATAAEIGEAHRKDLEIQDQYGVKFLTYWFDERGAPLSASSTRPTSETVQCVHREAHGYVAGEVVEVALSAVEAFLGRIQDPRAACRPRGRRHRFRAPAIMFTDIVGSTEMTARLGDRLADGTCPRARFHRTQAPRPSRGGREVKHTGDGIMASFPATAAAVECATAIQQDFQLHNRGNSEPIHIRIGLDCGEPVEDSNDLFGTTVQLAARLCSVASGDQILVSENIRQEHGSSGIFKPTKRRRLKGFSQPVPAFECAWATPAAG